MKYKIGVDVGGTFTDFLLVDREGNFKLYKTPTTPKDPAIGFFNGLEEMAQDKDQEIEEFIKTVEAIVHGTTITTNAVLTRSGAKTGLLTTKGFRDALQMRRGVREELYNNKYKAPKPLVPRYLRLPIDERVTYQGEITKKIRKEDIIKLAKILRREGIDSIAICFMNSYANPKNEDLAAGLIKTLFPDKYLTVSNEILPQVRFYDRTSTTVFNSYVGPILENYLESLLGRLNSIGFTGVLLIMQSNGGVMSPDVATKRAANTLLSGPAGGPVAGIAYLSAHDFIDCITIDMGGTSFDVALVKDKTPTVTTEGEVDRFILALPMLNIHTIGAGGGSIGWIDEGGLLRMGPQSAGADPGPACYGLGGEKPTCTDADLVLGYLNKDYFLGGKMSLYHDMAETSIKKYIAEPMGLNVIEAAAGMFQVINTNMAAGIREITIRRGLDPREFPLIVAGGAGPVHAGYIALELEIPLVIIPKESSIFCAAGMLLSDLKHDFVRTYHSHFPNIDKDRFKSLITEMEVEGETILKSEEIREERILYVYSCDVRYAGQFHEVNVVISKEEVVGVDLDSISKKFHIAHDQLYGYSLKERGGIPELINIRITCVGETEKPKLKEELYQGEDSTRALKGERKIFIPQKRQFETVNIFDGGKMGHGNTLSGPGIIEQPTTTILVPPEYNLICDRFGSYIIYLRSREKETLRRIKT